MARMERVSKIVISATIGNTEQNPMSVIVCSILSLILSPSGIGWYASNGRLRTIITKHILGSGKSLIKSHFV